jgi:putative transposase
MATDKLGSYGAARREIMPRIEHVQGKRENNRAEVSHQPTRQRGRQMRHLMPETTGYAGVNNKVIVE